MRRKQIGFGIAGAAVVLIGAAAYGGLVVYPDRWLRSALDQAITKLPPGTHLTYDQAHYNFLTHELQVTGLHFLKDTPPKLDYSVNQVTISAPFWAASTILTQDAADPAKIPADQMVPIADRLALTGLTFQGEGAPDVIVKVSVGSAELKNLRLYPAPAFQYGKDIVPLMSSVLEKPGEPPQPDAILALLRAEAGLALAFSYDGYTLQDEKMTETLPARGPVPAINLALSISKGTLDVYDRGVYKSMGIEGITVAVAGRGEGSLARVSFDGTDLRQPLTHLASTEPFSPSMLNGLKIGRISWDGWSIKIKDLSPVTMASTWTDAINYTENQPLSFGYGFKDLVLPAENFKDPRTSNVLHGLDLKTLTMGMALGVAYDPAKQSLTLKDTKASITELGALDLSVDLTNFRPEQGAANRTKLAHLMLHYDDASLCDRALTMAATQSHTDPKQMRQNLGMIVTAMSAGLAQSSPPLAQAVQALQQFIADPHRLSVELSPPDAIDLSHVQAYYTLPPAQLAGLFGLSVTAGK